MSTSARPRPLTHSQGGTERLLVGTRLLLLAFAGLTLVATNQLLVLAPRTETLFSWTIQPPLSAAFLGAGYGAGCVLSVLAYRARSWADARLGLLTVLIFATLTLIATVLHLDRFHFGAPGLIARFAAWLWLAVYVLVPVALATVLLRQRPATRAVPRLKLPVPLWLATLLGLEGALLILVGVALFVAPATSAVWWPWALTPLTARMSAAWLIALGCAAALALLERDLYTLPIPAVAYTVFGLLELVALAAYGDVVRWGSVSTVVYLAALAAGLVTGGAGLILTASGRRRFDRGSDRR